jgi:predicted short-subunit dehydrogenase-like oxidoreductase (DUF2520 family)
LAAAADVIFITTPDAAIASVAKEVNWRPAQGVVHCSGASGRALLQDVLPAGVSAGAFHPFQTFAGLLEPAEAAERLNGVTFAVSAEGWLAEFLAGVAASFGGRVVAITDEQRPVYHASAILSCGYLATLVGASVEIWQTLGFSPEEAIRAIHPLARATLENIQRQGFPDCVTGPLVRGDVDTVRRHLEALESRQPQLVPLYRELTRLSLPLAHRRGVADPQLAELRQLVLDYSQTQNGRLEQCPE